LHGRVALLNDRAGERLSRSAERANTRPRKFFSSASRHLVSPVRRPAAPAGLGGGLTCPDTRVSGLTGRWTEAWTRRDDLIAAGVTAFQRTGDQSGAGERAATAADAGTAGAGRGQRRGARGRPTAPAGNTEHGLAAADQCSPDGSAPRSSGPGPGCPTEHVRVRRAAGGAYVRSVGRGRPRARCAWRARHLRP
jgi:hypothetical protein